ncbi:MAG: bifunctional UDP-sugar hydrolase/5'-nucleotidase [Porphyromonas sp.]|nr:bifunctional UDP-sugar hydrolase/5'-nucleotidase [Porphyromonas sp.]
MKVFVNDIPMELHSGASVVDALRKYAQVAGVVLTEPLSVVRDEYGHEVAHDGQIADGHRLFYVESKGQSKGLLLILFFLLPLLASCGVQRRSTTSGVQVPRSVTIVAVNDMHATLDQFPRFAYMVDSLRSIYPDLLLVSAGDNQTGNPANDQYTPKGMPMIELMNQIGFDLSALGNHEYDTKGDFSVNRARAKFDFISSNLTPPEDTTPPISPYKIITMPNGVRLAFVSLLYINEHGIPDSHPDNLRGYAFHDPISYAPSLLHLRDSADVLIMLNHLGFLEDVNVAQELPAGSIDLIIGGHSHTKIDREERYNGVLITQALNKLKYLTLHHLTVNPDGTVEVAAQLLPITKGSKEDPVVRAMVDGYLDNEFLRETLAIATADFDSSEEIGYLLMDGLRAETGADIAVINAGGVRVSELKKGPVTVLDVYTIDPFGNQIITYDLTGEEVRSLVLSSWVIDKQVPLRVSGMRMRFVVDADNNLKDVILLQEDGAPLDMSKKYKMALNSYAATTYKFEHLDPGTSLNQVTADAVISYLRSIKTIPSYQGMKRIEVIIEP